VTPTPAPTVARPTETPRPIAGGGRGGPPLVVSPSPAATARPTPDAFAGAFGVAAAWPPGSTPTRCRIARLYAGPTVDHGWNQSHEDAFRAVAGELGYVDLTAHRDGLDEADGPGAEAAIEGLVQQGAHAVYVTSPTWTEAARRVAARRPTIAFLVAGGQAAPNDPPNLGVYAARIEEALYVAGQVAGLTADGGVNLGSVSPFPTPGVFRAVNAFALGVHAQNPTARIHHRWSGATDDPTTDQAAARALLGEPVRATILAHAQDGPTVALAAQDAGKLAIGLHADAGGLAPRALVTSAVWNWAAYYRPTVEAVCTGAWTRAGNVAVAGEWARWVGSMRDDAVRLTSLNLYALGEHPRREDLQRLYEEEVARFRSGERRLDGIFTGPLRDNAGELRVRGRVDAATLFEDGDGWFAENVVGSPRP
jgi:basic membrane protein A